MGLRSLDATGRPVTVLLIVYSITASLLARSRGRQTVQRSLQPDVEEKLRQRARARLVALNKLSGDGIPDMACICESGFRM